ncbi:type II secretion system protein GspD [Draconibacterium mangrovi]|uniref:type II secretion system protein GspD n=1 Tax=Draconibacterium mangrovi TaxID=2697469 RepID=UPI0013D0E602|nr:type II and III secretion system protein [Draconibacterium mangrovi]
MKLKKNLLTILILCFSFMSYCQNTQKEPLELILDSLSNSSIPQLNEKVDLSLNNLPLSEFVRTISNHVGLNITISPSLNIPVNNNFSGVKAKDIILMLCEEYNLNCKIYGNIINLQPVSENSSKCTVKYNNNLVSYHLENATLKEFTQQLSSLSDYNFFLLNNTESTLLNGFVDSLNIINAIQGLAKSNNLSIKIEPENIILFEPGLPNGENSFVGNNYQSLDETIAVNEFGQITINGNNMVLNDILQNVVNKLDIPFHQDKPLLGEKKIALKNVSLEILLNSLVSGTQQTYKFQNGVLHLGNRAATEMKTTRIVKFNYRRVDSLIEMLPVNFLPNVELKEFAELNCIMLTGDADLLANAENKLRELDVSVPVVLIDVIIIDVSNTAELETGIEAGLASEDNPVTQGGTINPGIDYTMTASSINNAISKLGLTKLGKVTPEFYIKLKALETNGVIDIRSTPQLSTLNGHAADLSIGETQYYEENRNMYQGSLNPQLETLTTYLPVRAQLGVTIEPFVTGNGDVTLEVQVEQSNFTDRYKEDAPPGIISRTFKSMIRVKNQEMVLLGGLEEIQSEKSHSGLPLVARIPIIKWFFTKTIKRNNKSRLNVFIKPTILY